MNVNFITLTKSQYNSIIKDPDTFYRVIIPFEGGLYDANDEMTYSWSELVENNLVSVSQDGYVKEGTSPDVVTELSGKLVFPEGLNGTLSDAFKNCVNLTAVVLPNDWTSLAVNSFEGCTGLTNAYLANLEIIGSWAFKSCTALEYVDIPASVTAIGEGAFGYSGLKSVEIPTRLTILGGMAFVSCPNLESVWMPNGADTIRNSTFSNCPKLSRFNSNVEGVANIDAGTVGVSLHGSIIQTLNFSDDITAVPQTCATDTALTTVRLPANAVSIANAAFYECRNLANIELPSTLKTIGTQAFYYCQSIVELTVPDTVTTIGGGAFSMVNHVTYHGSATGSPWGAKSIN